MKLAKTIERALPLLMRARVIDAVLETQIRLGSPVTAQEVRAGQRTPLMRHSRALTEVAHQIAELGADERGRRLHLAGKDRTGVLLWWVEQRQAARKKKRKAAKKRARKKRGG